TALDQLAGVDSASYSYDHANNLVKLLDGSTQTFNAGSELTSQTPVSSTAPATGTLAVDHTVSADAPHRVISLRAPTLTTGSSGEFLLALVTIGGDADGKQRVSKVSGGGLTWTRV